MASKKRPTEKRAKAKRSGQASAPRSRDGRGCFRIIGALICLFGFAPFVAVAFGAPLFDEPIEFFLVPMVSGMFIAGGLMVASLGGPDDSPLRRLATVLIGCLFLSGGIASVAGAVANLGDMKMPAKVVHDRGGTHFGGGSIRVERRFSLRGGFGMGLEGFFGMLVVGVGTGIAVTNATTNTGIRRGVAAILALAWHGVGVGACWFYCSLAPALDVWPFLVFMVYAWLGLIPTALAIPGGGVMGRLRSAVWNAMGGGFLGGVAGALIGGTVGGVAVVLSYAVGTSVVGTTWWLFAAMGGGLVTGTVFAVCRLAGWGIFSGDKEEEGDTDEEEREEPESPRSELCRKCRIPVESGLAECPRCGAPAGVFRVRAIGRLLTRVGFVCVAGTILGWGLLQSWLVGKGFNATVLNYLLWMIFIGGWLMIGIGSGFSSAQPVRGFRGKKD